MQREEEVQTGKKKSKLAGSNRRVHGMPLQASEKGECCMKGRRQGKMAFDNLKRKNKKDNRYGMVKPCWVCKNCTRLRKRS